MSRLIESHEVLSCRLSIAGSGESCGDTRDSSVLMGER